MSEIIRAWLLKPILDFLHHLERHIMTTSAEITQGLTDVTALVAKIGTESAATLQKVTELEAVIAASAAGTVSPELTAAFEALKAQVLVVDALVPDATPTPAP